MLEWLVLVSWTALGTYLLWFLFKAETNHPLNLNDLAMTWRMHKQQTGCKSSRIQNLITISDETVGFKCQCGYQFIQKRLIMQKTPTYPLSICGNIPKDKLKRKDNYRIV